jgi:hypothetical protein
MEMMSQMMASADAPNMGLAWTMAIAGGALMATYPVFIKVPRVVAARVNPWIFQSYKSFWVFALAFIFLLVNYLRAKPLFIFTWWAVAAAALWVPAGFATIAAVGYCGVATTAVFDAAVNSTVQFLVSLMLDQTMKTHGASNVPFAPIYLAAVVVGMVGLILSPRVNFGPKVEAAVKLNSNAPTASTISVSLGLDDVSVLLPEETKPDPAARREYVVGVLLAMLAGLCSALKFAVKHIGSNLDTSDSATHKSKFGIFESYMISFGLGCAMVTPIFVSLFCLSQKAQHKELPSLEFPVMKIFGFLAGAVWFGAYMCQQAANDLGGQAGMGPAVNAIKLVVAGIWGLLYYREIKGPARITCWVLSAAWTITFVLLLSSELEDDA